VTLPSISVVIPTYNRAAVVERTLRHLDAQEYPAELVEVLVVDNSTDETPEMVERFARSARIDVRLLAVDERLPAVKRNIGLRAASGELVLFINDDVWFVPEVLAEHAKTHAEHEVPIAVVGHVQQSPEMPTTPFIEAYEPFAYGEIAHRADQTVEYTHFWSMNLSLPRRVMLERNLVFHEDWAEIGHEDVELGYRWTRAGLPVVYNPRATGDHFHPHTIESACRLQASVGRGLRDLEVLIPERRLLERYGVLTATSRPKAMIRGAARHSLFNRVTVPTVTRWLERQPRNTRLTRWTYWKVLLHHTNRAYRTAPPRHPAPTPTTASMSEVSA
jgi:glycosyltransferase involved in cell wall biosynthesis